MVRLARLALLPLLLLNITTSANDWRIAGVSIGVVLFWAIIATAAYLVLNSPYRAVGAAAVVAALLLRVLEAATHQAAVAALRHASLGVLMMTAGASAYGRYPRLLTKQLAVFFALCLPIMLLQVTGAHSIFLTWDIDPAHDPAIMTEEEIGTFKMIPVYPTLWVPEEELHYQMAQGRPSGLLYANNVLSVFIPIAAGLALAANRRSRVGLSGLVILAVLILAMSMTAFAATAAIYLTFVVIGPSRLRRYALKAVVAGVALMWCYAQLFPGLFATAFSREKMLVRVFTRGLGLFDMIGVTFLRDLYDWTGAYQWGILEEDTTYSGIEQVLRSPMAGVAIVVAIIGLLWYGRALAEMRRRDEAWIIFPVTAAACLLTQFGVPYYGAPSFQVIAGFALYPIFQHVWPGPTKDRAVAPVTRPATAHS